MKGKDIIITFEKLIICLLFNFLLYVSSLYILYLYLETRFMEETASIKENFEKQIQILNAFFEGESYIDICEYITRQYVQMKYLKELTDRTNDVSSSINVLNKISDNIVTTVATNPEMVDIYTQIINTYWGGS